ncbi:MAG: hypothetical protein WBD38_05905, partial [Candidatus Dormiibacterota bacterium]
AAPAAAGAPAGAEAATGPPPGPVGPTAPRTAQAWFDEQGILVLSYIGAFLLVVATLLFEIYGLRGTNGVFQFSAVLALNLLFGVLGWLCLRSTRLRVVGRSYIGIFALMSPLVVVAAYQFLVLREHGVSPEQALFFGASYCTILYGILATRLGSVAYAWLSLVALPVAAWGLAAATGVERWAPLLLAGVCVVYLVPTFVRDSPAAALFSLPAKILPAVVGPAAILLAVGYATQEINDAGLRAPYLPMTFFLLAAAYAGHSARWRAGWLSWAVPTAISLGALTANVSLRGDANSAVLTLLVLAYGYAIAARPADRWGLTEFFRFAAAVQALACVLANFDQPGIQAAVLLLAAGVGVLLALDTRQPWWLLVFTAIFSDAWYWLVKAVVPPPPSPGPDVLAQVLSPLPVVFSAAAISLRARLQPPRRLAWAAPLYLSAGAMAVITVLIASSAAATETIARTHGTGSLNLVGWLLVGYGLLTYVVGLVERQPIAVPFGGGGIALGATVLLVRTDSPAGVFPLVLTAIAVTFYMAHFLWQGGGEKAGAWVNTHRWTGAAILGLTTLYGYAIPAYSEAHNAAVLSTVVTILALAGLLYFDGRLHQRAHSDLMAMIAASFILGRLATYLDLTNVQFHVIGPGLALILAGRILVRRDRAQLGLSQVLIGAGSAGLLLVTLFQTSGVAANASFYIALLLAESVVAIVVGVSWRSRVLVVVGGVGAALAALRALYQVAQFIPLYAVFGIVAIIILVVAAALALARDRLVHAGTAANSVWKEWD